MEIHIVFDGPPGPQPGRFVEVENERGESIAPGRWEQRSTLMGPTLWHLVITPADLEAD